MSPTLPVVSGADWSSFTFATSASGTQDSSASTFPPLPKNMSSFEATQNKAFPTSVSATQSSAAFAALPTSMSGPSFASHSPRHVSVDTRRPMLMMSPSDGSGSGPHLFQRQCSSPASFGAGPWTGTGTGTATGTGAGTGAGGGTDFAAGGGFPRGESLARFLPSQESMTLSRLVFSHEDDLEDMFSAGPTSNGPSGTELSGRDAGKAGTAASAEEGSAGAGVAAPASLLARQHATTFKTGVEERPLGTRQAAPKAGVGGQQPTTANATTNAAAIWLESRRRLEGILSRALSNGTGTGGTEQGQIPTAPAMAQGKFILHASQEGQGAPAAHYQGPAVGVPAGFSVIEKPAGMPASFPHSASRMGSSTCAVPGLLPQQQQQGLQLQAAALEPSRQLGSKLEPSASALAGACSKRSLQSQASSTRHSSRGSQGVGPCPESPVGKRPRVASFAADSQDTHFPHIAPALLGPTLQDGGSCYHQGGQSTQVWPQMSEDDFWDVKMTAIGFPDLDPGTEKKATVGKKRVASERNRRCKIREGLQLLRETMNGQNDYATTLHEAVSYIKSLQNEVQELKAQGVTSKVLDGVVGISAERSPEVSQGREK